jgi:hypothetical protein
METTTAKYAHYLRVSTQKQGIDGYGIDAQRVAIAKRGTSRNRWQRIGTQRRCGPR